MGIAPLRGIPRKKKKKTRHQKLMQKTLKKGAPVIRRRVHRKRWRPWKSQAGK